MAGVPPGEVSTGGEPRPFTTALSPASKVSIEYFEPPRHLRRYVTTLFHFRCDDHEIHDAQPADVGKLMIVLKGDGSVIYRDGSRKAVPRCSLQAPTTVALPFHFVGGFHSFGAALTPLGWAALSRMPANECCDQIFDTADILGDAAGAMCHAVLEEYDRPDCDLDRMGKLLTGFIENNLAQVPPRHAALVEATVAWLGPSLDPDLDDLYAQSTYSKRQTQRLVERYFGLNPQALKRKYRAVRAAAILSAPEISEEQVIEVMEHFYDQSHLIREIGIFVGRTPSRLGGQDSPILNELLDLRNFRVFQTPRAD